MGPRARRILYQLHLWLGVALALPLLMAAITGSVLLFRYDIVSVLVPGADRDPGSLTAAEIGRAVEQIDEHFGAALRAVRLPDERIGVIEVTLKKDRAAYVDPATGSIVREWDRHADPLDVLFDLHHHLLAGEVGQTIMGIVSLLGVALLLFGMWLWCVQTWPFRPRVWPSSSKRIGLLAAHRDLGILVALPLLIVLLSGAVLAFPNGSRKLLDDVLPGAGDDFEPPVAGVGNIDWQVALRRAVEKFPDSTPRIVVWPASANKPAVIRVRQSAEWHPNGRTSVYIDPATSQVLASRDALAESLGGRLANAAYPLHAGTIGRPWIQWLGLLVATATLLIACYGFIAWLGRYRKHC